MRTLSLVLIAILLYAVISGSIFLITRKGELWVIALIDISFILIFLIIALVIHKPARANFGQIVKIRRYPK